METISVKAVFSDQEGHRVAHSPGTLEEKVSNVKDVEQT